MTYHIAFKDEHGKYHSDEKKPDLASAIRATLTKTRETLKRHYIFDSKGKLIDIVNPA
jgi:hypothetical protein